MCFQVADSVKPCVRYCSDRLTTLGDSHSPCRHSFLEGTQAAQQKRDGEEGEGGSTIAQQADTAKLMSMHAMLLCQMISGVHLAADTHSGLSGPSLICNMQAAYK